MTKEKRIEKMARDLGIAFQLAGTTHFGAVAEVLVDADYRPASDVAREIFEEIESKLILNKAIHCGQKFYYTRLEDDIAELKRKYTEGEGCS